jgi:hypothetical protein
MGVRRSSAAGVDTGSVGWAKSPDEAQPRGQPRARRFCPRGLPGAVAHPTAPYSAACAIARPSVNSRRSIAVGTSQT